MVVLCDLEKLKELNLSPSEFCFLHCLWKKEEYPYSIDEQELENGGWLKIGPEGLILRQKFLNLVSSEEEAVKKKPQHNVEEWIDDWRALWPSGTYTMGRLVKGDRRGCIKKLILLLKDYPKMTKEDIFAVTKIYLQEKARGNNKYITCADYFISKNGVSQLAARVEEYKERGDTYEKAINGDDPFTKEV